MKIRTLIENTTCRPDLTPEHGLSLYIETGEHRILFDAGQSDAFADDAEKLGIDLSSVDLAILSHGHYDHGGGLCRFLEINSTAPIYLSRYAFEPHYNGSGKFIGLPPELAKSRRLIFTEERVELAPCITLAPGGKCVHPIDPFGLTTREGVPEDFRHEQHLLIEEDGRRVLFSGCSHKGILNIVDWFRPDVLIGGFHFKQLDPMLDADRLAEAAHRLLEYPTTYYTGHCTGQAQFAFLKRWMGGRLHARSTGSEIEL